MRLLAKHTAHRAIGAAFILASSTGLSGCVAPEGVNLADEYGDWAGFCGIFQVCGSDSDTNRGGSQTASGTSSDSSSSSTGGSGGESATPTGGN